MIFFSSRWTCLHSDRFKCKCMSRWDCIYWYMYSILCTIFTLFTRDTSIFTCYFEKNVEHILTLIENCRQDYFSRHNIYWWNPKYKKNIVIQSLKCTELVNIKKVKLSPRQPYTGPCNHFQIIAWYNNKHLLINAGDFYISRSDSFLSL